MALQIVALGGGGFLMEPENPLLDKYLLAQTGKERPKVAYLPQAAGEHRDLILAFAEGMAANRAVGERGHANSAPRYSTGSSVSIV